MDDVNFRGWRPEKSVQVVESNGRTRVFVKGKPYMSWPSGEEGCVRLAIAQLYECGLGTEEDLAEAFGRHVNSVQKYLKDFAGEGIRGLISERRGPKGRWKLTAELRGKILRIVLREGIWKLEAIQQRLLETWQETVSLPSIQQVLEENGLGAPPPRGVGDAVVQGELFALEPPPQQLALPLDGSAAQGRGQVGTGGVGETPSAAATSNAAGSQAEAIPYLETTRTMNKYGKIRAVVIRNARDNKRAAIYTNGPAEEIGAERIVPLMCRRWGEENAIKELLYKHLIDYTPGYVFEELEEQPLVDNPELKELKKQRAGLVSELNRLKIELADHLLEPPGKKRRPPPRSQKEVRDDLTVVEGKILLVDEQLDKLPSAVRFDEAHAGEKLLKLNHEKKRFLDCLKVLVCNLKAEMCRLLLKHYDWEKEVVPALAMIVERTGHVKLEGGCLEVTLRRFTNGEIDYAARHLCEDLNGMRPVTLDRFHLPIRYHVQ